MRYEDLLCTRPLQGGEISALQVRSVLVIDPVPAGSWPFASQSGTQPPVDPQNCRAAPSTPLPLPLP